MRRLLLSCAMAVTAFATVASATSIRLRPLPELVMEADQILQGRVVAVRPVDRGDIIVTEYDVDVSDWLKPGPHGRARTITIIQPGGTVNGRSMIVVGAAQFSMGDEVMLFTRDYSGRGEQQVANLVQGALAVGPAEAGIAGPVHRLPQASGFPGGAPEDLDAFKSRVRELVAGSRP